MLDTGYEGADSADFCAGSAGDDDACALSMSNQRARIGHATTVGQRRFHWHGRIDLVYRGRFAGQRGFLNLQRPGLQQAQVSGNLIAGLELHKVTGHQVGGIQSHEPAAAPHHRVGGEHVPDGFERVLGLPLLDETDGSIGQHHAENHARVEPVLQKGSGHGRSQQHIDQHVVELGQEAQERAARLGLGKPVGTVSRQAPARLLGTQTLGTGADALQRLRGA